MRANLPPGVDPWGVSLKYLMGAVAVSGGCLVSIFSYMQRKVMTDPECVNQEKAAAKKKKKRVKMSLKESAQFLMSSTYIRDLAMLVISYGMCINLVEVSWKSKLKVSLEFTVMRVYKMLISIIEHSYSKFCQSLQRLLIQTQMHTHPSWGISLAPLEVSLWS